MVIWKGILLGVVALLLLLLLCPITVHGTYDQMWQVRLRVLGIPIPLWPRPAQKPSSKKKKKAKPSDSSAQSTPQQKETISPVRMVLDHLETAGLLLEQGEQFLGRVGRAITLHHLRLWMLVAGNDPAQTGIRFGRANAVAYGLLAILQRNFRVRDVRLDIRPNFLPDGEEGVRGEGKASACPAVLLWAVIRLAAGVLPILWPLLASSRNKSHSKQPEEKAV